MHDGRQWEYLQGKEWCRQVPPAGDVGPAAVCHRILCRPLQTQQQQHQHVCAAAPNLSTVKLTVLFHREAAVSSGRQQQIGRYQGHSQVAKPYCYYAGGSAAK